MSDDEKDIGAEIVIADGLNEAIQALKSGSTNMYSSIQGNDFATRKTILQAVTNSVPISENIGKTITLQDIIVQRVDMTNDDTGEVEPQPRILFIDTEGVAYHAISAVLFRDVQTLFSVMGDPNSWDATIDISVAHEGQGKRKFFTLKYV